MADEVRVRINFSTGEIEISGSSNVVREWWQLLDGDITQMRQRFAGQVTGALVRAADVNAAIQRGDRSGLLAVPENFGEFLHQFPSEMTDIEKALVAGYFVQSRDASNSFATGPVNELLLQQAVRLTNPSASIKRNIDARRAILLGGGQFRVSQIGIDYLRRLLERERSEAV